MSIKSLQKQIFVHSNSKPELRSRFNVTLDPSIKSLSDTKILGLVRNALGEGVDEGKSIRKLHFFKDRDEAIQYRMESEERVFRIGLVRPHQDSSIPEDTILRVVKSAGKALPKRTKSIKEIYSGLMDCWAGKTPVVTIFWTLIAAPLALLIRCTSPKVYDTELLERLGLPGEQGALLRVLEWGAEALDLTPEEDALSEYGEKFSLSRQLQEGIELGKKWDRNGKNSGLGAETAEEILSRYKQLLQEPRVEGKAINLMLVPGGYWKDQGDYHEVLWAFYINSDGNLCQSEITYGQTHGAYAQDYIWKKGFEEGNFKLALPALFSSKKPQEEKTKTSELTRMGYLVLAQAIDQNKKTDRLAGLQEALNPFDENSSFMSFPLNTDEYRQRLLLSFGAEIVQREERSASLKANPWKILQETIRVQFPEAPIPDKAMFTYCILNDRLEKILTALDDMKPEQKRKWLYELNQGKQSFERQMRKLLSQEDSEDIFTEENTIFKDFADRLDRLREEVEKMDGFFPSVQKKREEHLNKVHERNYNIRLPKGMSKKAKRKNHPEAGILITSDDLQMIESIREGFVNPNTNSVKQTISALKQTANRMDHFVEKKQYGAARKLYRQAIKHLPPVEGADPKIQQFWAALADVSKKSQGEGLKEFSANLAEISHYFWEAKMFTFDLPLESDEWVQSINTQAVLTKVIDLQIRQIQEKNDPNLSYDDAVLLQTTELFDSYFLKTLDAIANEEMHLRPSLSAHHEAVLASARTYIKNAKKTKNDIYNNQIVHLALKNPRYNKEEGNIQKAYELWAERNPGQVPKNEKEKNELTEKAWLNLLQKTTNDDMPRLHPQVIDLYRHQLMLVVLVYGDRAIGFSGATIRGKAAHANALLQLIPIEAGDAKQKQAKYKQMLKRLIENVRSQIRGFHRLDLMHCHNPYLFGYNPEYRGYGIAERGTKPGKTLLLTINPAGKHGYNWGAVPSREPLHKEAMGMPKATFYDMRVDYPKEQSDDGQVFCNGSDKTEDALFEYELSQEKGDPVKNWRTDTLEVVSQDDGQRKQVALNEFKPRAGKPMSAFSSRNVEEVFDMILQNPEMLDGPEERRRFVAVAFRPHLVQELLRKNPNYFKLRGPGLKDLVEDSLEKGKRMRAAFLGMLTHHILLQTRLAIKQSEAGRNPYHDGSKNLPLDSAEMALVADALPSLEGRFGNPPEKSLSDLMISWIQDPKITLQDQMDLSAYFLSQFCDGDNALDPGAISSLQNPEQLAHILVAFNRLLIGAETCTIPQFAASGVSWVQDHIAPWLLREPQPLTEAKMSQLIDKWILLQEKVRMSPGAWKREAPNSAIWKKGDSRVDIRNMQILTVNGVVFDGVALTLPKRVVSHPDFKCIFGEKVLSATAVRGSRKGEIVYTFSLDSGDCGTFDYKLFFNSEENTLSLEMRPSSLLTGRKENDRWYRFVHPTIPAKKTKQAQSSIFGKLLDQAEDKLRSVMVDSESPKEEGKGIEKHLLRRGVWVDTRTEKKGISFLSNDMGKVAESDILNLMFGRGGKLQEVKTLNKMKVVNDNGKLLEEVLSPIPEEKILFLRNKSSRSVKEIHLLGQGIVLKRSGSKKPWMVSEGDYKGFEWVLGGGQSPAAKNLLQNLGVVTEDIGITLRDPANGNIHLLAWPQQITTDNPHRKDPSIHFTTSQPRTTGKPVKLIIKENDFLQGSCGSFLFMAYLHAQKHDYAKAAHFISEAGKARLENEEEIQALEMIRQAFRDMPGRSVRSNAIKLKAELAFRKVVRQQTHTLLFDKENWKGHLDWSKYATDTHRSMQELAKKSAFAGPELESYRSTTFEEISLNAVELAELQRIKVDSFDALTEKYKRLEELKEFESTLWVEKPAGMGSGPMMAELIITKMHKPHKNQSLLFQDLNDLDDETAITRFFELWNGIIERKIPLKELTCLYRPTPGITTNTLKEIKENGFNNLNKGKIEAIVVGAHKNLAKKMLLSLARYVQDHRSDEPALTPLKVDLDKVYKLHQKIPGSIPALAWRGFLDFRRRGWLRQDNSVPNPLLEEMNELENRFKVIFDEQCDVVTLREFNSSNTGKDQIVSFFSRDERVDLNKIRTTLEQDPYFYGPEIGPVVELLVQNTPKEFETKIREFGGFLPVSELLDMFEKQTKINLSEKLHEAETARSVAKLEARVKESNRQSQQPIDISQEKFLHPLLSNLEHFTESSMVPVSPSDVILTKEKIENSKKQMFQVYSDGADEIERYENSEIRKGVKEAAKRLEVGLSDQQKIVNVDELENLSGVVEQELVELKIYNDLKKQEILSDFQSLQNNPTLPKGLRKALQKEKHIGEASLMGALLNSYQRMELDAPELEKKIMNWLFFEIQINMVSEHGRNALSQLQVLKEQLKDIPQDDEHQLKSWRQEWNLASFDFRKVVRTSSDYRRYLDKKDRLTRPTVTRKFLVAELRNNVILTPDQRELISAIIDNPSEWYQLRMGLGKTTVIFPIVLMLLAEKGYFPVGMVKSELVKQNIDSLDKSTRLMIEQAGMEFHFDINEPSSPATLAESYHRLLRVKEEAGYVITTVHDAASIEHKLGLMKRDVGQLICELLKIPPDESLPNAFKSFMQPQNWDEKLSDITSMERQIHQLGQQHGSINDGLFQNESFAKLTHLHELQKSIYWLTKIRSLLRGNEKSFGFRTQIIGDEVDDIFNLLNEDNLALGKPIMLDRNITGMTEIVLGTIFRSNHPDLKRLREAIQNSTQAALRPAYVREKILPAIVEEIVQNNDFLEFAAGNNPQDELRRILAEVEIPLLQKYLCEENGVRPPSFPQWKEGSQHPQTLKFMKAITSLKGIIKTFPVSLNQNPDINVGIKKTDGFTVGPKVQGQEKKGTIFGVEYDVTVNHYLSYVAKLPDTPFIQKAVNELQETRPQDYDRLSRGAAAKGCETVFDYVNLPENWQERLLILRSEIIQKSQIRRYKEQFVLNHQEIVFGLHCGGMSGTPDKYLLPKVAPKKGARALPYPNNLFPKLVDGETFLRIASMDDVPVEFTEETSLVSKMKGLLQDPSCKAFINEGSALQGRDALQVIQELREDNAGKQRTFVFVDPTTGKDHIWYPGHDKPKMITKKVLEEELRNKPELRKNCFFYFGPPDTRGRDLKIPPGYVVVNTGPTTNMSSLLQTIWRARGLGCQHTVKFMAPNAVKERIAAEQSVEEDQIAWYHLANDCKRKGIDEKKGLNLKKVNLQISSIVTTGVRDINNAHQKSMDTMQFWDPTKPIPRLLSTLLDASIDEASKKILVKSKAVNFEQGYEPTSMIELEKKIDQMIDRQQRIVKQFKQDLQLSKLLSGVIPNPVIANLIQNLPEDQWFDFIAGSVQAGGPLLKSFGSLSNQFLSSLREQNRENLSPNTSSLPSKLEEKLFDGVDMESIFCLLVERLSNVNSSLKRMESELEKERGRFKEKIAEHLKQLPAMVPSDSSAEANAQEQVQEQQQQQQQQQEQQLEQMKIKRVPKRDKISGANFIKWNIQGHGIKRLKQYEVDCWIEQTENFEILADKFPMFTGEPIARVLVHKKWGNNNYELVVMTHADYHYIAAPYLQKCRKMQNDMTSVGVYTMLNGAKPGGKGWMLNDCGNREPDLQDSELRSLLVQVKWALGYFQYSNEELEDLRVWLEKLWRGDGNEWRLKDMKRWIDKIGNPEQMAIFRKIFPSIG